MTNNNEDASSKGREKSKTTSFFRTRFSQENFAVIHKDLNNGSLRLWNEQGG